MAEQIEKVIVPDIGGAEGVDVIDIIVAPGDTVGVDDSIVTLEGDKASMDIPSSVAGTVKDISVKLGDKVSEGALLITVVTNAAGEPAAKSTPEKAVEKSAKSTPKQQADDALKVGSKPVEAEVIDEVASDDIHAGPAVRRIAREFGVNLKKLKGTGEKGRVVKEDVQKFVKQQLKVAESGGGSGFAFPPAPKVDFSKFGEVEEKSLNKIKKATAVNMHRNWVSIPHVTQFGDADITEMEAFRKEQKAMAQEQGVKLTPLVFIMKAVVAALKEFPSFNASLSQDGETLILKHYFHVGVAVDTPNGLVVPVIRDVDRKGLFDLAKELGEISTKAREKGLGLADMQGGCFTISSLGGIGGTAFTPIINAPEVAILGVSKASQKPVYQEYGEFVPRLTLPLSLSYDHRVIDGAEAARFIMYLAKRLEDIRTLLL